MLSTGAIIGVAALVGAVLVAIVLAFLKYRTKGQMQPDAEEPIVANAVFKTSAQTVNDRTIYVSCHDSKTRSICRRPR
jgi:hypothetical protein